MSDYQNEIWRLRDEARQLPHGPTRVALLEEAVRLADHHRDVEQSFHLRSDLVEAATFGGRPEVSLVAFSWCLAQFDRDPERYDSYALLWKYKWVASSAPQFPQIPAEQIDAMFDDMQRRFAAAGSTVQVVDLLRRGAAMAMGDRKAASQAHRSSARKRRGFLSDCYACECSALVEYLAFQGKYEQALERAKPVIQGGMRCMVVPHTTYSYVLLPLLRLQRLEEAMDCHLKGYALIARNAPKFVRSIARHVEFLALTDNLARAVRIFDNHLHAGLDSDPSSRFYYLLAGQFLVQRLLHSGKDSIKLRWPGQSSTSSLNQLTGNSDAPDLSARANLPALRDWLDQELAGLARLFDERNGNDSHARQIKKNAQMKKYVTPFPLPGKK